jgi:hypothetical protein
MYCHISRLKTINNELKILQVNDPDPDIAYELFENHQAIVFQRELHYWKEFNKLIGNSLIDINKSILDNKEINYSEYIKNNIDIYNLPLSYDWNIDIRNVILNGNSSIFFTKQNNYMQLFGCVSGEFRIIIATPDQSKMLEPFINMVSTIDATNILDKDPLELNYIEIIIRQGNMIYIPWNWFYFIYKSSIETETVIIGRIVFYKRYNMLSTSSRLHHRRL